MVDTSTPILALTKPDVGASDDTWGNKLNVNFDKIDQAYGTITAGGVVATKAYVDTENAAQDVIINGKVDQTYVDSENDAQDVIITNKADVSYVDSENATQDMAISDKADVSYVDAENDAQDIIIGTKASTTFVNSENAAQNTVIAGKASTSYVDMQDSFRVAKSGDIMTGALTLNADPVNNLHAATKQYVDAHAGDVTQAYVDSENAEQDAIIAGKASATYVDTQDALRVLKSGDTMTGYLTLSNEPINPAHVASKNYVDARNSEQDIIIAGKAPTVHTHTASQVTDFSEAVDDRVNSLFVAGSNISLSYNDAANTFTISSTASGDVTQAYVDSENAAQDTIIANKADTSYVNSQDALKLNLTGGTLSGFLTLHSDPTSDTHAATKKYVDDHAGIGGTGAAVAFIGDSPPISPVVGQLWWQSSSGNMFIYFDDGTSLQWVPTTFGAVPLPPTIALSANSVLENSPPGTVVGIVYVAHGYTGTPVFTLTDDADGAFELVGNELRTVTIMDFEAAPPYYITISVSGITPPAPPKTFYIHLVNVLEPIITLSTTTIVEDAAIGATVGTLSVTAEFTGTPVFTLVDDAGGKFSITGSLLKVASPLDYETDETHNITVAVSGITPDAPDKVFTVVVLDAEEEAGVEKVVTYNTSFNASPGAIDYSGGDLIATGSASSTNWNNAIANIGATKGKYYCEFRFITSIAAIPGWALIGLRTISAASSGMSNLGSDNLSIGWSGSGLVLKDNGTDVALASVPYAQNDWLAMTVDLTARKIWFKNITAGSTWNGVGGDPDAGTGGITTSAAGLTFYPSVSLAYGASMGYSCEANFGATAYAGSKPSTFENWSTVQNSMTWNAAHPLSGSATYTNNDITATGTSTSVWNTIISSNLINTNRGAKYYCEFHIDTVVTASEILVGIATNAFTENVAMGDGGPSFGWNIGTGTVKYGTVDIKLAVITAAAGDYVGMTVDEINSKIWFKNITAGGTWNGVSGDPVAGTGSISISSMVGGAVPTGPTIQLGNAEAGNAITANFGATAYQEDPPAGFLNWGADTPGGGVGVETVNIVTDYGAVADGDWAEETFTILAGSTTLTCNSASIWEPEDEGKSIVVSPIPFGSPLFSTIVDVVSGSQVTLAHAPPTNWDNIYYPTTPPGSMNARPDVIVSWGTNNGKVSAEHGVDGPFEQFRIDYQGKTVKLIVPAGSYLISCGNFFGLYRGIRNIVVEAAGATFCGGTFQIGTHAQSGGPGSTAYTETVAAGSTFVTLKDPTMLSRFVVNNYVLMTGFDMQQSGWPTNQAIHEYLKIVAIDDDTDSPNYGRITFLTPLKYSYKSTWPLYSDESFTSSPPQISMGGPATLYAMDPLFDTTQVVKGLTIASGDQYGGSGVNVTFIDCVFEGYGQIGPHPTMAIYIGYFNCYAPRQYVEVDKLCEVVEMEGCTWGGLTIQSSSINEFILDNTTVIDTLLGSPRKMIIRNGCTFGTLIPGPSTYGYADVFDVRDSFAENFGSEIYHRFGFEIRDGDGNTATGIEEDFTMASGVITVPASMRLFTGLARWAITDGRMHFYDANIGTLGLFTITDVTEDGPGGNVHVHTDWTRMSGGFPPSTYVDGLWMTSHVASECTFVNVDGCAEVEMLSNLPTHSLGSRYKRTFDGSVADGGFWQLSGVIKKVIVTVTTAYSGPTGTVTALLKFGNATVKMSNGSQVIWDQIINLKATAPRTITFDVDADPYPTAWVGGVAGDVLVGMTEAQWATSNFKVTMTNITGEPVPATTRPVFTVEVICDHGL